MSGGKNGRLPHENLAQLRALPEPAPEPVMSKCSAHPTKRAWDNEIEAAREAVARSEAVRIPIVAIRCNACDRVHLCKEANAREGTIVVLPVESERNWEVFAPTPGNPAARAKMLEAFLEGKDSVSTSEIVEHLGFNRQTAAKYMRAAGWRIGRGGGVRWAPSVTPVVTLSTPEPEPEVKALEASISRHPASSGIAWRDMDLDAIQYLPVGDVLNVLRAAGIELRMQARGSVLGG